MNVINCQLPEYGKRYIGEASTITKTINDLMKVNDVSGTNESMRKILDEILVSASQNRVSPGDWCLNTNMEILENHICLLAHWKNPNRMLAVLSSSYKNNQLYADKDAIGVIPNLQYKLYKLETKKCKHNRTQLDIYINTTNPRKICTTKRGWYAIHLPTFNRKIVARRTDKGLEIDSRDKNSLLKLYYDYVEGMNPMDTTSERNLEDIGMEQFLLNIYPLKNNVVGTKNKKMKLATIAPVLDMPIMNPNISNIQLNNIDIERFKLNSRYLSLNPNPTAGKNIRLNHIDITFEDWETYNLKAYLFNKKNETINDTDSEDINFISDEELISLIL